MFQNIDRVKDPKTFNKKKNGKKINTKKYHVCTVQVNNIVHEIVMSLKLFSLAIGFTSLNYDLFFWGKMLHQLIYLLMRRYRMTQRLMIHIVSL